jgi:hypothetical protein
MSAISTRLAVLGIIVGLVAVAVTPVRAGSPSAAQPAASDDVTFELARAVVGAPDCGQPSDSHETYAPTGETVDLVVPVCARTLR